MRKPPFLQPGDTIGITATARKISPAELNYAVACIEEQGYRVKLGRHLFAEDHQFAGNDAQRAADFHSMIDDAEVKAILIARGGYGTMRMVDLIDFSSLRELPKWVVGYSDVTVLHSALHQLNIPSLHATMPINFDKHREATMSLFQWLSGNELSVQYEYNQSVNAPLFKEGTVTAPVVGGNLSLLYALQGSKTAIQTAGKILFIEDLDEYLYHIDRMMLSLKRSGMLDNLAGLIVGGMTDMKDNAVPFGRTAEQIIAHYLPDASIPVCYDFPAGHVTFNHAVPLGVTAQLEVSANQVTFQCKP